MSQHQVLRDLVSERLTAAAEEIFSLFERMIMEYEEELCRCKAENQRKQDQVLNLCVQLHSAGVSPTSDAGLKQEIIETAQIEEAQGDHNIKEEDEQPSLSLPKSSDVYVKSEAPPFPAYLQTELQLDIQRENKSEPHSHSQTVGQTVLSLYTNTDYERENVFSTAEMETEANGENCNPVQITGRDTAGLNSEAFVPLGISAPAKSPVTKRKNYPCPICLKGFRRKMELERHMRVHTGEKPYGCWMCPKTFSQKVHLEVHMRTHTSEKPYSCSVCPKTFAQRIHLKVHLRTHTGERPYSCFVCSKTFTQKSYHQKHMTNHTKDNPV